MNGNAEAFVTKPVAVEAYQWDGTDAELYFVVAWVLNSGGTAWVQNGAGSSGPEVIRVETQDGIGVVSPKSWVVRDPRGEFKVLSDAIFNETFEKGESIGDEEAEA